MAPRYHLECTKGAERIYRAWHDRWGRELDALLEELRTDPWPDGKRRAVEAERFPGNAAGFILEDPPWVVWYQIVADRVIVHDFTRPFG